MSDPYPRYQVQARSPVLVGNAAPPRPFVVRDARILSVLAMVFTGGMIAFALLTSGPDAGRDGDLVVLVAGYSVAFALAMAQFRGLGARNKLAWQAQVVISLVGVLSFPIGTLIHGWVLRRWFAPEVKEWFGIPVKPLAEYRRYR